ncbi:3-oxoacyl-[acyl-carrier-protein] synthase, mitochondrial [Trachymyrmex zeteki]|uniref:beta-ketoacyl-[acyl-carrier-protein] synthase I n=1 Tax=Mycetomoellerius zeteki TaxID=64791 RepID=A0A151XB85_9HYME|nr:3-oxoacyl-[acyl-carrier-protein] synthase, mitochondrial [Trachymyrmex zeteki]
MPIPLLHVSRSLATAARSKRRVVVTGIGIVCPLGVGTRNAWEALIDSKCGIVRLSEPDYDKLPCKVVPNIITVVQNCIARNNYITIGLHLLAALVPKGNSSHELNIDSYFTKSELRTMCPATAYALIASEEALADASWKPTDEADKRDTGVSVGIGMIDLVDVCMTYEALKKGYSKISPFFVPRILPNMAAGQISIKYGFRGPNHSVSTACATGAHAIGDAFRFIRGGETTPSEDGTGALLAMDRTLKDAGIETSEVTHVNAHATSTPLGDAIEVKAIESLMGEHSKNVTITSTKGAHGHLLGAAGNLEAAFTILAIKEGIIPPTLNLHNLNMETDLRFAPHTKIKWNTTTRRTALKNAFGFGGTNACLCFTQYVN